MKFKIGDKAVEILEDDGMNKNEIVKNVFKALKDARKIEEEPYVEIVYNVHKVDPEEKVSSGSVGIINEDGDMEACRWTYKDDKFEFFRKTGEVSEEILKRREEIEDKLIDAIADKSTDLAEARADGFADKKVEDIQLFGDLSDYEPWGQAKSTWEKIQREDKIDALDNILEDIYPEGMTFVQLNDLLAYEWDEVYEWLGISDEVEDSCKDAHRGEASEDGAQELFLYATNDGRLYRQIIDPIINNLHRKHKKGIFDDELAVKAFMHAADDANKRYEREFGETFNVPTRELCARKLLDYYEEDIKGEWVDDSCKKDSILTEYADIRKDLEKKYGKDFFDYVKKYLDENKGRFLSDIYYNKEGWKKFADWYEDKTGRTLEIEETKIDFDDAVKDYWMNRETGELVSLDEIKDEYDYSEWEDTSAVSIYEEWKHVGPYDFGDKKTCKDYDDVELDELRKEARESDDKEKQDIASCVGMINSILAYDHPRHIKEVTAEEVLEKQEKAYHNYLDKYVKSLGREKVLELIRGQLEDIDVVKENVGTDGEGVSYNSIRFKKKAKDSKKSAVCDVCEEKSKKVEKLGDNFFVCPECKAHMSKKELDFFR